MKFILSLCSNLIFLSGPAPSDQTVLWDFAQSFQYDAADQPASNPMKGFVSYPGQYDFPHSMEYSYFGFADLMPDQDVFAFDQVLEPHLEQVTNRGNQSIIRVYLDYPDDDNSVPQFLLDAGVTQTPYSDHGGGMSPDYDHPAMVAAIESLVQNLGERYDGDPRLAYVQVGILGHWGEWHTYPNDELFASRQTQIGVLTAYSNAFQKTPVLVSQDSFSEFPTLAYDDFGIGFHDDAFTEGTLGPDDWMFIPRLNSYGYTEHWKQFPIGGEILPDHQSVVWDVPSGAPQDFTQCVLGTHATWLLNYEAFENSWDAQKRARAIEGGKLLGYNLFINEVEMSATASELTVRLEIENKGVAPFYGKWPVEISFNQETEPGIPLSIKLSEILPTSENETFTHSETIALQHSISELPTSIQIEVIPPDPRLKPFRFSNSGYNGHRLSIQTTKGVSGTAE